MSYDTRQIVRHLGSNSHAVLLGLVGASLLALPHVAPGYFTNVATQALIFALFAVAVDIALGYAGLITLAPAAFFGLGAYAVAITVVILGGPFWAGIALGIVAAAVLALFVGYIPIKQRIGPVYFALFTMAFGVITYDFVFTATWLTGGSNGLGYIVLPAVAGIDLNETAHYYYFVLSVVGFFVSVSYLLLRSGYGDVLHAIHQNELRMRYLGYNTDREKLTTWIISAVISAIAGALFVGIVGIAAPSMTSFALTGEVLIWVIVGGAGTFVGPFVAAFFLTLLENYLGGLWAEGYLLVLGVLFVAFVLLLPEGVMGLYRDVRDRSDE